MFRKLKSESLLLIILCIAFTPFCYAEADILPGNYGTLWIGFNPESKIITGHYENYTGWDEETGESRFSCIFYLQGKVEAGPPYKITTWYPADPDEVIMGQLNVVEAGKNYVLSIYLDEEHGGCWNVEHFVGDEPAEFVLEQEVPWREIRVIAAEQAFLYDMRDAEKKTGHAFAKDTAIGIYDIKPGWVYAESWQDEQLIKGWIKSEDLYPVK